MDSSKKVSKHKKNRLPNSSRVCDEVMEYYEKHGEDRDIIKYMRLSSCSSGKSNTTSSSSISGLDGKSLKTLFDTEVKKYKAAKSNSLPNVAADDKTKERIIPITMEPRSTKSGKENVEIIEQNFKTPQKETRSKETQTPESVTKSNRILEWDSLGDVGYIKSKSTSNISLLERSVLKDVLQELSSSGQKLNANNSEGNLIKLNEDIKKNTKSKSKSYEQNLNTPLASSTLLDTNAKQSSKGARPKRTDVSTSTSYTNFQQKSVQTSLTRLPERIAQEVQVNMSPISDVVTTTTPSSFDYLTTHSSHENVQDSTKPKKESSTTKLSDPNVITDKEAAIQRKKERLTARLTEIIQINARNNENNTGTGTTEASQDESAKFEEVRNTLKTLLDDNQEVSSSNTSITRSPQLDLGIQLLCSLIEAKSLNDKQKKKLLRDIVNKIIAMSSVGSSMVPYNPNASLPISTSNSQAFITKSAPKIVNLHDENKKSSSTDLKRFKESRRSSGYREEVISIEVYEDPSKTSLKDVRETEPSTEDSADKNENTEIIQSSSPVSNKFVKRNKKISESDTVPATTTASSRTSKDITKSKPTTNTSNSNTDGTTGEWLNPLTQSEIEYEEKKLQSIQKQKMKKKQNVGLDTERKVQLNWIDGEIERLEGLRYLLLKQNSLIKESETPEITDNAESATTSKPSTDKFYDTVCSTGSKSSSEIEKCVGEESEEIDVIIEESNEDVLNKKNKVKFKRDRVRETQIIYDRPTSERHYNVKTQGKPLFRTVTETVTTHMQQLPTTQSKRVTDTYKVPNERSKIKTPSSSNEVETVDTYGQQRKREFLDQYNRKKKDHHETLVQKQQEQELQLKDQKRKLQQQKKYFQQQQNYNTVNNVRNSNNYYSVPQPTEKKHSQHPERVVQSNKGPSAAKPHRIIDDESLAMQNEVSSSTSLGYQQNVPVIYSSSSIAISSSDYSVPMGSNNNSSTTTTTHQYDTVARSQPVATIGVQTSNSLVGTNAAFNMRAQSKTTNQVCNTPCQFFVPCQPRMPCNYAFMQSVCCRKHSSCCRSSSPMHLSRKPTLFDCAYPQPNATNSLGIQVTPKSIAYVITFDGSTEATSSPQNTNNDSDPSDEQSPQLTLQEYLYRAKPKFYADAKQRKSILNEIQLLRQERNRELRDIVEGNSFNSIEKKLERLPPPPTNQLRIFPTKEMKALTKKRFANLPEVVKKQEQERVERYRRGNRLLRDIFNRRLQKRVRNGKISLNHSKTII